MVVIDIPVSIETKKIPHASPKIQVYYPVVRQMPHPTIQLKINHAIISTLNKLLIEQNFYEKDLVEMVASYEIKNNQRNLLSLNLIVYSFTGGAHGMTVVKSLTFDTNTGKQYKLSDLFKDESDYEQELSNIIRKDIKRWNVDVLGSFEGIKSDQDFYIADTSLVIYFQLYEITPYVWGFPYFPVPILDIQNISKHSGPLNRMLAFT